MRSSFSIGSATKSLIRFFERDIGVAEGPPQLCFGPLGSGRIGHAPMGGHGIARPNGAQFAGGLVADREDEIHHRRTGPREFMPAPRAIYADRFDSYAGQKLQVTGEQPAAAGVMVHSQIVKANGEAVNVDYMMRRNGNAWLISDIYLDGAISEVATRRSEFAAILKNEGIDGLIAALNRKADILTGTAARSSNG